VASRFFHPGQLLPAVFQTAKFGVCAAGIVAASGVHQGRPPGGIPPHDTNALAAQLVEQRLGVFQIGCVEAFSEPVVDFGKRGARFFATPVVCEQARQA